MGHIIHRFNPNNESELVFTCLKYSDILKRDNTIGGRFKTSINVAQKYNQNIVIEYHEGGKEHYTAIKIYLDNVFYIIYPNGYVHIVYHQNPAEQQLTYIDESNQAEHVGLPTLVNDIAMYSKLIHTEW